MRTTKRFTPTVIRRFVKQGRGEGTGEDYVAWHRISRGDPASSGRSHLLMWRNRLRDLLSDGEQEQQLFATMLSDLEDSLEQFKLTPEDSLHPLSTYQPSGGELFEGTLKIAQRLGIKHPQLDDGISTEPWRLTTDHVLVTRSPKGDRRILAVAYKPDEAELNARQRQLLSIEREYWQVRKGEWLLITPRESERAVRMTLRRVAPWALGEVASDSAKTTAIQLTHAHPWACLTSVLVRIASSLGSMELAQNAFWQAVWSGALPLDLRRGWRPYLPLTFVTSEQFSAFNPIASGRSAWT